MSDTTRATREERLEILHLLEAGTITTDEAARLLDALDVAAPSDWTATPVGDGGRGVRLRITNRESGRTTINLLLPLAVIERGFGFATRFMPQGILGDSGAVREAVRSGFTGVLLDIEEHGERVQIIVE